MVLSHSLTETGLVGNERGATMLEYGLLAALIAVVAIVSVTFVGRRAHDSYCSIVRAQAPKYQPPTGGGEGEPPDVDDCGLIWGQYAP